MKFLFILTVGVFFFIGLYFLFVPLLKEEKYIEDYNYLKSFIDEADVTFEHFMFICGEFDRLNKNNYFPTQTSELRKYFMKKYQLYHSSVYDYNS